MKSGTARWDEQLTIKEIYKSLPDGKMQDEAAGKEFPLSRYADLMISINDNTASDHLLHRLGREQVEAYMSKLHDVPSVNTPFLTTRDMFSIKLSNDSSLMKRWPILTEADKRDMLLADDPYHPTRPAGKSHNPGEIANWTLDKASIKPWKTP